MKFGKKNNTDFDSKGLLNSLENKGNTSSKSEAVFNDDSINSSPFAKVKSSSVKTPFNEDDLNAISNKEKVVRLNWKKILIIGFVIVALITGITLGVYYGFKPKPNAWMENVPTKNGKDIDSILDDQKALHDSTGKDYYTVVFVAANDCDYCNFSIYGDLNDETGGISTGDTTDDGQGIDKSSADGPFSLYAGGLDRKFDNSSVGSQENYGGYVYAVHDRKVGETQYMFSDIFFGEQDYTDVDESPNIKHVQEGGVVYKIEGGATAENAEAMEKSGSSAIVNGVEIFKGLSLTTYQDPETKDWFISENGTEAIGSVPAWLYFQNGYLKFYTSGIGVPIDADGDGIFEDNTSVPSEQFWVSAEDILIDDQWPDPN